MRQEVAFGDPLCLCSRKSCQVVAVSSVPEAERLKTKLQQTDAASANILIAAVVIDKFINYMHRFSDGKERMAYLLGREENRPGRRKETVFRISTLYVPAQSSTLTAVWEDPGACLGLVEYCEQKDPPGRPCPPG